jgi:subtilisin family serine protease
MAGWGTRVKSGGAIRVAIVDSGVDASHPALDAGVQGYVAIGQPAGSAEFAYDFDVHGDEAGHGTSCAVLVRSIAPDCELYSVKVLDARCLGRASVLTAGLHWAIEHRMDVCNLSLGTVREQHAATLRELTDEASAQNVVLVAAANDRGVPSYPASCRSVLSVGAHGVPDPMCFWSDPRTTVDFLAWGVDVPIQARDGTWALHSGSSLAAAHMSGVIAAILAAQGALGVRDLREALHQLALDRRLATAVLFGATTAV